MDAEHSGTDWKAGVFQYGLRSLFALVTIIGCIFGFWIVPSENQRKNVAAVRALGGIVAYSGDSHQDSIREDMAARMPRILRERLHNRFEPKRSWFPKDYVNVPRSVHFVEFTRGDRAIQAAKQLPTIRAVSVDLGRISENGIAELARLERLEELDLGACPISDRDLVSIAKLPRLRKLVASAPRNEITDRGVECLAQLNDLCHLELAGDIEGKCFEKFDPTRLRTLKLDRSMESTKVPSHAIGDDGATHISKFRSLKELAIRHSQLTNDGVQKLTKLCNLVSLDLSMSPKIGGGFEGFAATSAIRRLDLSHTAVTDDTMNAIGEMQSLEFLDLSDTRITDLRMEALSGLTALCVLRLGNVPITDETLVHLGRLRSLQGLDLRGTLITNAAIPDLNAMGIGRLLVPPRVNKNKLSIVSRNRLDRF